MCNTLSMNGRNIGKLVNTLKRQLPISCIINYNAKWKQGHMTPSPNHRDYMSPRISISLPYEKLVNILSRIAMNYNAIHCVNVLYCNELHTIMTYHKLSNEQTQYANTCLSIDSNIDQSVIFVTTKILLQLNIPDFKLSTRKHV